MTDQHAPRRAGPLQRRGGWGHLGPSQVLRPPPGYPLGSTRPQLPRRIGPAGAITATAHKLARLVYAMLKHGREYVRTALDTYEDRMREQQERSLRRKAASLGFALVPTGEAPSGEGPFPRRSRSRAWPSNHSQCRVPPPPPCRPGERGPSAPC